MKITKIAGICKKKKAVVLYERFNGDGEIAQQYISDTNAIFPVTGLPFLDKESITTIFDVPEEAREKWFFNVSELPRHINVDDIDENEQQIETGALSVIYAGKTLKPLETSRGLVFIESRYLAPLIDVRDVLELYERRTPNGEVYIVAKAGFLLQAVIMPYDAITEGFTEGMERLARLCRQAFITAEARRWAERSSENTQTALLVDPDTGEILEEEEAATDE